MKRILKKLLGFRSGKPWKMALACLWYLMGFAVLFFGVTTPVPVEAGAYDAALYRVSVLVLTLWIFSPAIFLSDTAMRRYLPLFRMRSRGHSLLGMMIVFLFFAYLFGCVESLHSDAYRDAFDSYISSAYQAFIDAGTDPTMFHGMAVR